MFCNYYYLSKIKLSHCFSYWYEQNNPPVGVDKKGKELKPISIRGISNKYFNGKCYETIRDKISRNVTGEHASGGRGRKRGQEGTKLSQN